MARLLLRWFALVALVSVSLPFADAQEDDSVTIESWVYEPGDPTADRYGWRSGADEIPGIEEGDEVITARASRAEVRLDAPNWLRVEESSTVAFPLIGDDRCEVDVDRGVVYYGQYFGSRTDVRLRTPLATAIPLKNGRYEISALDDGKVRITVRRGKARIIADDDAHNVGAGQAMVLRTEGDELQYLLMKAAPKDGWFDWNLGRDRFARKLPAYREAKRAVYRSWPAVDFPLYCPPFPGAW